MLAQKMAQFSCSENEAEQHGAKDSPGENNPETKAFSSIDTAEAVNNISEAVSGKGLTKQWSTSSKSSRSSKRGGEMLMMALIALGKNL